MVTMLNHHLAGQFPTADSRLGLRRTNGQPRHRWEAAAHWGRLELRDGTQRFKARADGNLLQLDSWSWEIWVRFESLLINGWPMLLLAVYCHFISCRLFICVVLSILGIYGELMRY